MYLDHIYRPLGIVAHYSCSTTAIIYSLTPINDLCLDR
ncbi:unnamed protein product [Acanthoscelides obtectus]|uniref:Uncharacterized protein n=1 Tax=Acanthoscelides obtectus TaxID=200917 RepID=A0A9P0L9H9_ACAOB|nr:unnamed protein product [Acanthoscelides obtectus]CAK1635933.1 hypothetical protein AOBTE_LOCUS9636 [Acanthoscelides obtectus]